MPIEIRELIIKATVSSGGGNAGAQAGAAMQGAGSENNGVSPGDEMIKTCIEKVLEILNQKYER